MAARTTYAAGWRLYPLSVVGHHVQGSMAAVAATVATPASITVAIIWTALYIAYQGLSVLRKEDSPGLDIADYLAGFGAGLAGLAILSNLI